MDHSKRAEQLNMKQPRPGTRSRTKALARPLPWRTSLMLALTVAAGAAGSAGAARPAPGDPATAPRLGAGAALPASAARAPSSARHAVTFEELYRKLRIPIYKLALRVLGNHHDAEDA